MTWTVAFAQKPIAATENCNRLSEIFSAAAPNYQWTLRGGSNATTSATKIAFRKKINRLLDRRREGRVQSLPTTDAPISLTSGLTLYNFNAYKVQSVCSLKLNKDGTPIGIYNSTSPKVRRQERTDCMGVLYSTNGAAEFLHVSTRTLKRWRKSGKLVPCITSDKGDKFYSAEQLAGVTGDTGDRGDRGDTPNLGVTMSPIKRNSVDIVTGDTTTAQKREQPPTTEVIHLGKIQITDELLAEINNLKPDQLVAAGVLDPDKSGRGYCCPLCHSGTGKNGTGMEHNKEVENHTSFKCFACGEAFNVLKICSLAFNLSTSGRDYPELIQTICERFGLHYETITTDKKTDAKTKYILADINRDADELKAFVDERGGKWRGLTLETLLNFNCRYNPKWLSPSLLAQNPDAEKFATATPRLIIPASTSTDRANYLARLTCNLDDFDERQREYVKPKPHEGRKSLFNPRSLFSDSPIFIVEGEIDAMSIWQACNGEAPVVALTGASEHGKLFGELERLGIERGGKSFVILLDGDKAGKAAAANLREKLLEREFASVEKYLFDFLSSDDKQLFGTKADANAILQARGDTFLKELVTKLLDGVDAELDAAQVEIERRKLEKQTYPITQELREKIFSGDDSDVDFSERLIALHGDEIRLLDRDKWLTFCAATGIWQIVGKENSAVFAKIHSLSKTMTANAKSKRERELAAQLKSSKKYSSTASMLKSHERIFITSDDLNRHDELLPVANGTLDLSTGILYPNEPRHFFTRQATAEYRGLEYRDEDGLVEKFLSDIQPDEDTKAALIRFLGYSLSGLTSEHVALFWRGSRGANGKSTLEAMLMQLLGEFGSKLAPLALLESKRPTDGNVATAGLNPLEGSRLAFTDELPREGRLNSSLFKAVSGGDKLPLRQLHQEIRKVRATAKLILVGNFLPKFDGTDGGIRRRIRAIDFNQSFTGSRADSKLPQKLATPQAQSALLSILAQQAKEYFNGGGLLESEAMKRTREDYFGDNDLVRQFVEDHCVQGEGKLCSRKNLINRFRIIFGGEVRALSDRDIVKAFSGLDGVRYVHKKTGWIFEGLGLTIETAIEGEPVDSSQVAMPDFDR